MKPFKTTWILAAVLGLLILAVYFFEIQGGKKRQEQKEKEEKIFVFEKDQVESIRFKNSKGTFFAKKAGEKGWFLEEPLKTPADKLAWNNMVDNLYDLKFIRVISEKESDLTAYGLKDSRVSVEMNLKNKDKKNIHFGDDNPIGDSLFATPDKSKVVLVPQHILSTFDKDLKDLREKKLFTFDEKQSESIEVYEKGTRKVVLKKDKASEGAAPNDKWFVLGKKKEEVDSAKVMEFLNALNFMEVRDFTEEDPKDIAKYGLKSPSYKVIIRDSKTAQLELLLGKKENNTVYVSKAFEKPVYGVNDYILTQLPLDPSKLIKKEEKK